IRERRLDRVDLGSDSEVALAVTEVSGHGPDRVVNLERILPEKVRGADALDVASRIPGYEWVVLRHRNLLRVEKIQTAFCLWPLLLRRGLPFRSGRIWAEQLWAQPPRFSAVGWSRC